MTFVLFLDMEEYIDNNTLLDYFNYVCFGYFIAKYNRKMDKT